jgi:hypothetical protein
MDVNLSDFIELCDNVSPAISADMHLQEQYESLKIKSKSNSFSASKITDILSDNIKKYLSADTEEYITYYEIDKLKKALIYKEIIEQKNYKQYIDILVLLNAVVGSNVNKFIPLDDPRWTDVILNIKNYLSVSRSLVENNIVHHSKEIDRAKCALSLRTHGAKVYVDNTYLMIDNLDGVYKFLTKNIKKIGGIRFIEGILSQLKYVKEFDRYIIPKQGNKPMLQDIQLEKPYNYLINLGFRYVKEEGTIYPNINKDFQEVINVATSMCFALYPVQPYSIWEDIFHRNRTPIQFFKDLILKESIFNLPQTSSSYTKEVCHYIISKLSESINSTSLPFSLNDYLQVLDFVLSHAQYNKFVFFFRYEVRLTVKEESLDKIFDAISQDCDSLNTGYLTPLDSEQITYWIKPLIRCRGGKFAIIPKTIGSWGFYEAFMIALRPLCKNIDSTVGSIIENFIKYKLDEHNISSSCGKYTSLQEEGECDTVIESKDGIVLIESKKKSLTRKSKSGEDFQIIIDIANSVLDSQLQCMRTESILKSEGYIDLNDGKISSRLNWNQRTIENVTLTFTNFGAIQDREMTKQTLYELCKHYFTVSFDNTELDKKTLNDITKKLDKLKEKQNQLIKYYTSLGDNHPFFNSWFLNLEQFIFVINLSNSNDDFYEKLKDWKYVTFGCQDFYLEYYIKHLRT